MGDALRFAELHAMSGPQDTPAAGDKKSADRWLAFVQMVAAVDEAFKSVDRARDKVRSIEWELDRIEVAPKYGRSESPVVLKLAKEARNVVALQMTREAETDCLAAALIARSKLYNLQAALSSHLGGALIDLGERIRGLDR